MRLDPDQPAHVLHLRWMPAWDDVTGSEGAHDRVDVADDRWYQQAVFYEVSVRGFYDANGDGTGDIQGLIEKLDYLQWLGVDCIWLLPFYSVAPAGRRLRHQRLLHRPPRVRQPGRRRAT